ncbi:MAG: hypothetical protein MI975_25325 [Cytophagales bacterium]|nr:hypothetical protein [Cytophagales bacterium]
MIGKTDLIPNESNAYRFHGNEKWYVDVNQSLYNAGAKYRFEFVKTTSSRTQLIQNKTTSEEQFSIWVEGHRFVVFNGASDSAVITATMTGRHVIEVEIKDGRRYVYLDSILVHTFNTNQAQDGDKYYLFCRQDDRTHVGDAYNFWIKESANDIIYQCDETSGTTSIDRSGNGNNGVITLNGTLEQDFYISTGL